MEDEHIATSFVVHIDGRNYPVELFGIFDGHGGNEASRFVRDHLAGRLYQALREFNPSGLTEAGIWRALKVTFVRLNQDFKNTLGSPLDQGTTATVAMILDGKLWTANVGDARTVLDNGGEPEQLTEDAKPSMERYKRGIENRGGTVENIFGVPRVNGQIAVARAIGDHRQNGAISARPKITVKPLSEIRPGSHLILCCDGIYDVARTKDVVRAVHANRNRSAGTLAKNVVYSAYTSGSTDNLSCMVVKLKDQARENSRSG
jgi:protein phosphatase 1L